MDGGGSGGIFDSLIPCIFTYFTSRMLPLKYSFLALTGESSSQLSW